MYSACLFCQAHLGSNESVEHFPVGRRLAFDPSKGRLWVVCRVCERWNLSPLEERWEAGEECERLFRDTRLRVSTENIGLARLKDGTELVRIGQPLRPEIAAWRYGDQFRRRQRRALAATGLATTLVVGAFVGSSLLTGAGVGGNALFHLGWQAYNLLQTRLRPNPRIRTSDGELIEVPLRSLPEARIRPTADGDGWRLEIPTGDVHWGGFGGGQRLTLTGEAAFAAAGRLLPRINQNGASRREVEAAVREIEAVGDPRRYFIEAEYRARHLGYGHSPVAAMPKAVRLALEMAAHEESERQALEGELRHLEEAWKDAEEVAAIADRLTIPEHIEIALRRLKHRVESPLA